MKTAALGSTSRSGSSAPGRKQAYVSRLEAAYSNFVDAVEDLDEKAFDTKWIDGRWGVREIAAHVAGWHGQFSGGLERLRRGEPLRRDAANWRDVDGLNATFAAHAKGKRKPEILLELDCAVNSFTEAALRLPDYQFDDQGIVTVLFSTAGYDHFHEHTNMIRRWREAGLPLTH